LKAKDQAEVSVFADDIKSALKSDELQQDLDRRALDVALADELSVEPAPFNIAGDDSDEDGDVGVAGAASRREEPEQQRKDRSTRETPALHEYRLNRMKTTLRDLEIEAEVANLGRDSLYKIWHAEGIGTKKKLVVTTNADHPFYQAIESDFVLWVKLNIIESVAEFFTEATATAEAMLNVKSDIMKRVSQIRLARMDEPFPATAAQ
jgi:hypothetical protein